MSPSSIVTNGERKRAGSKEEWGLVTRDWEIGEPAALFKLPSSAIAKI
ncbi:hypothetical protein [Chlorogloeopsis sp. ULAP02]